MTPKLSQKPSSLAPLMRPDAGDRAGGFRIGLRTRILVFAVLLAALPLLVSSVSMVSETRDELKSAVNDRLLASANSLMGDIRGAIGPGVTAVSFLASAVANPGLDASDKQALLTSAIESMAGVQALRLGAYDGAPAVLLHSALAQRLDAAQVSPERAAQSLVPAPRAGAKENAVEVGAPFQLAPTDVWLAPISTLVAAESEAQAFRLTAYVDVTPLRRSLEQAAFASQGAVWLLDAQVEPLFALSNAPVVPELMTLLTQARPLASESILVAPYRAAGGNEMLGAVGAVGEPPWILIAALPTYQAYGTLHRLLRQVGLWLGAGLLVAVLGALGLAQRISRPIREMARVADRVRAGDFQVRFTGRARRDEIGTLGRGLNQMIEGLAESYRRLDRQAHHDFLTGLPNRRFMINHLQQLVEDPQARREGIALLFIDLDRFKAVNDSLGHAVGDQLLKMAAQRLVGCLDEGTKVARLGGDEFLVVLRGLRDEQAMAAIATELIRAMGEPFSLMDYELYVGGTIGISVVPEEGARVTELLDMSDMAMYWGKEQGRGHFRFFSADLKRRAVRKLALDSRLRKALEREELEVYYQPQIDLATRRIVATEALLRWPDGRGGFVASPGEFIPLAEETGVVVPIGHWVMDTVCRQARDWERTGLPALTVSVNVSAMQFRRPDFFERVRGSLDLAQLAPAQVGLELTEGMLIDDTERAIRIMAMLKEMGVQVMIDDFGTGYSSLAYLRRFPLDYLKVAQEFVMGIGSNQHDAAIVGAVIALAKNLGLKIIAEGVETSEQLAFLSKRHCDLVQGFYFGRPVAAEHFYDRLVEQSRRPSVADAPPPCNGRVD